MTQVTHFGDDSETFAGPYRDARAYSVPTKDA